MVGAAFKITFTLLVISITVLKKTLHQVVTDTQDQLNVNSC